MIDDFLDKNIHVVGIAGAEGSAIVDFLINKGASNVIGHDFHTKDEFRKSFKLTHIREGREERNRLLRQFRKIKINYKENYLDSIENADLIFVSQAWFRYPPNFPKLQQVRNKGIPFATITQLYFDLSPCKIIGITGTNGKSTTAKLANEIFQSSVFKTFFSGNDRHNVQVLNKLDEMSTQDAFILEISNRQLLELHKSPYIAVITNLTPDHLDDHGSWENYLRAKKRIFRFQKENDFAILNYDDVNVRKISNEIKSRIYWFSQNEPLSQGAYLNQNILQITIGNKTYPICHKSDLKVLGKHNIYNVLAASLAAFLFGVSIETIQKEVVKFTGLEFRIQLIHQANGISYYNDIKSTTPEATLAALDSFNQPIILIAGGDAKGLSFIELAKKIVQKVKSLILVAGTGSDNMRFEILKIDSSFNIQFAEDLEEAVNLAKTGAKYGDVVLLSPACPGFFTSYVIGSSFSKLVRM